MPSQAALLTAFGFTQLESEVYLFLLKENPATGYRISLGIRKAAANTYKAITALEEKGAILVEASDSRLIRPVPPEKLFSRMLRDYERNIEQAKKRLTVVTPPELADRIYALTSAEQVRNVIMAVVADATHSVVGFIPKSVGTDPSSLAVGPEVWQKVSVRDSDLKLSVDGTIALIGRFDEHVQSGILTRNLAITVPLWEAILGEQVASEVYDLVENEAGGKRLRRYFAELPDPWSPGAAQLP